MARRLSRAISFALNGSDKRAAPKSNSSHRHRQTRVSPESYRARLRIRERAERSIDALKAFRRIWRAYRGFNPRSDADGSALSPHR
jgi:hypothetical protein